MKVESGWQPLPLKLTPETLAELLDGGQAFRWNATAPQSWRGVWSRHVVDIQLQGNVPLWRALTPTTHLSDLLAYLGNDEAWDQCFDQLPWRSDPVLAQAMETFPGLRILRQPLGETLLGFLCSSNKQILQIKGMLEALSQWGRPLAAGLHALPTWAELTKIPDEALHTCKLGYRARYLSGTAQILATKPTWETDLKALPTPEAHAWLCQLPGVGPKVADCVLLFGAGKLDAFPIDTWIFRILGERYGLGDWTPKQLQTFAHVHYGPYAGLAQQYLFASARKSAKKTSPTSSGN